ncbi:MAG: hypothetical protein ACRCYU_06120, partial [Nocardioides sp.]
LNYDDVRIANLCAVATPTVVELNAVGSEGWELARTDLADALENADGLLAGWGVAGVTGLARRQLLAQVDWLYEHAAAVGLSSVWMVGGQPRHPSRWHQFVSDEHERTSGGTADQRLREALISVPLDRRESVDAAILFPQRRGANSVEH